MNFAKGVSYGFISLNIAISLSKRLMISSICGLLRCIMNATYSVFHILHPFKIVITRFGSFFLFSLSFYIFSLSLFQSLCFDLTTSLQQCKKILSRPFWFICIVCCHNTKVLISAAKIRISEQNSKFYLRILVIAKRLLL